jgi:hypothetical protein
MTIPSIPNGCDSDVAGEPGLSPRGVRLERVGIGRRRKQLQLGE